MSTVREEIAYYMDPNGENSQPQNASGVYYAVNGDVLGSRLGQLHSGTSNSNLDILPSALEGHLEGGATRARHQNQTEQNLVYDYPNLNAGPSDDDSGYLEPIATYCEINQNATRPDETRGRNPNDRLPCTPPDGDAVRTKRTNIRLIVIIAAVVILVLIVGTLVPLVLVYKHTGTLISGQWSDWGACSVTCGRGHQTKTRLEQNKNNSSSQMTRDCYAEPCQLGSSSIITVPSRNVWDLQLTPKNEILVLYWDDTRTSLINLNPDDQTILFKYNKTLYDMAYHEDQLLFTDLHQNRIMSYSESDGLKSFSSLPFSPYGLAIDGDTAWVTAWGDDRVIQLAIDVNSGIVNSYVFAKDGAKYRMKYPIAVAVHGNIVAVSCRDSHNVHVFAKQLSSKVEGRLVFTYGSGAKGNSDGQLHEPQQVAFDDLQNLYIADYQNHRVVVVDNLGHLVAYLGVGSLRYPRVVTFANDNIYVSSTGTNTVFMFDTLNR